VDPYGYGSCKTEGCPKVLFDIRDFPGNTTWNWECRSSVGTVGPYTLRTNAAGNGYSTNNRCLFGRNVGTVTVVVSGNGQSYSGSVNWQ
jgi:hypothetical protein